MRGQFTSLACVAAVSLLLAACGSDDAASVSTDAPAESTAEPTEAPADTAAEPAGGDGVAVAQARVDEFSKTLTEIGVTEPVAVPANLEVFYAQCPVPVCEQIAQGLQGAVDAIGGTLTIQAYDGSPEGTQAAFQSGVQAAPDIFMSSGNPVEWYEQELVEFEELGIPVVQWSIPGGLQPDGMTANLITGGDYYFQGVLIADWITAQTGGKANVLAMNMGGTFPVLGLQQQGFENQMAEVCPDCKVNAQEISLDQLLAGDHISVAISEFQKDPEINYIYTGFGDMLIGLHDALADNGLAEGVPSASQAGTTANYQLIADGKQAIDIGLPSEFLAYRALDAGLRALAGQDIGRVEARPLTDVASARETAGAEDILIAGLPLQILTTDTVGDPTTPWPGIDGFQDQFLALWDTAS